MSNIRFIQPISQPSGTFRLLDWLEANFRNPSFQNFRCLVAFAKIKPFYKLHSSIQDWNLKGKSSEIVIGIDHKGTSYQALQYALANFDEARILNVNYSTFHPKLYIFYGSSKATAYYGSSNLTSGGLETNFEGGVILDFNLPHDQAEFDELFKSYLSIVTPTVPCTTLLTPSFLAQLKAKDLLLDETVRTRTPRPSSIVCTAFGSTGTLSPSSPLFGSFPVKPARTIPKSIMTSAASSAGIVLSSSVKHKSTTPSVPTTSGKSSTSTTPVTTSSIIPLLVDGFVTQIAPHDNGEILLSKLAIDQNRSFFVFPFTGRTIPKKPTNPTYPQRNPDPVVNINVFDASGTLLNTVTDYNLNTVYYEKKSEVRITITPSILSGLRFTLGSTDFPILVMKTSTIVGCDYDMDFYAKGSIIYNNYLAICDQTLPSGGNSVSRKMGWI